MFQSPFQDALVLTGPTGSGKTQLGIELAERLDAEIISTDSMALYRRLDIGTAKPTTLQRQRVRHHLIDVLEPWQSASVAWWLKEAGTCCREINDRGKQVLFVGGTPLYLKAMLFGLFDGPPADAALRQRLVQQGEHLGPAGLHGLLAQVDSTSAARLHPNDSRRIIRALEVFELTGRPISAWQSQWVGPACRAEPEEPGVEATETNTADPGLCQVPPGRRDLPRILWLDLPRPVLYDRIERRVEEMFASGLVEEVRALAALEQPLSREARQALGYKEVFAYLEGALSLKETIVRIQTRSRHFAKRQITWFRHLPGCLSATAQLTETLWQPRMKM